jgi:Zn-dependent protease with chaperone function
MLVSFLLLGSFLWIVFSGAFLVFLLTLLLFLVIICIGYSDSMVLYLLGARGVRSGDEKMFFEASSQEAYKLSVPIPKLYFYNGSLERAFVLQNRQNISLILSKGLIEKSTSLELRGICFELLLQVKRGMATKRTKLMFLLGFTSWIIHSLFGAIATLLPFKEVRRVFDCSVSFILHPLLGLLFQILIGKRYFRKLEKNLNQFSTEKELLRSAGLKIEQPFSYYSLPSRKVLEFMGTTKSRHFQNIQALEFLPHEWDFLFHQWELKSAE